MRLGGNTHNIRMWIMKYSFKKIALAAAILAAPSLAGPGLADGFAKFVGNITTRGQVRSDFGTYWNQITAENECKWASIEGSRGNYNFSGCDAAYNWAKKNGGHFKFHALVWGSQYPNWLNGLSAADTKTAITNWFDRVAKQYPDLEMIDVVNEAIRGGNGYHSAYGNGNNIPAALGGDNGDYKFVVTAFQMARERWPNAILIYNDYNTVQWDKDGGINLINTIKKGGAPVDAYGLQAHDMMSQGGGNGGTGGGGSCLNINTLKSVINEIWEKTQMPMFISEYDIFSTNDNTQKQCYQEQISYFMENEHIAGITIWGYIYGATWNDGTSGIIKDGKDRAAMTWLKEYFGNEANKAKSKNTTGLAGGEPYEPPEPVPQEPFKGTPSAIPGKIEVEDYDKNGVGEGNTSFEDDYTNDGGSTYRGDDGVDIYDEGTGHVLGMTQTGEWLEYTVNIAADGEYTIVTNAAAGGTSAAIKYYMDDVAITDEIKIDQTADNKWDVYKDFSAKTTKLTAGKHVLKLEITGDYANVDYFTFVAGDAGQQSTQDSGAVNPQNPLLVKDFELETPTLQDYNVYDATGHFMGVMSAYGFNAAVSILKETHAITRSGVYMLRSRSTGALMSVRVVR